MEGLRELNKISPKFPKLNGNQNFYQNQKPSFYDFNLSSSSFFSF